MGQKFITEPESVRQNPTRIQRVPLLGSPRASLYSGWAGGGQPESPLGRFFFTPEPVPTLYEVLNA